MATNLREDFGHLGARAAVAEAHFLEAVAAVLKLDKINITKNR